MDLKDSLYISASGMKAQGSRLKVISENIANANSTGETPEDLPYRRKTISFKNVFDRELGLSKVDVSQIKEDQSEFKKRYDPAHPNAREDGYVLLPNVSSIIEMMDMKEASKSYQANLNVLETSKKILSKTIDLLRS